MNAKKARRIAKGIDRDRLVLLKDTEDVLYSQLAYIADNYAMIDSPILVKSIYEIVSGLKTIKNLKLLEE